MEPRINNTDKNERTITYQEDGKLTMTVRASDPVTFNQITTINSSVKELEQKFTRMEDQIGLEHLKVNHEFSDIKTNLKKML